MNAFASAGSTIQVASSARGPFRTRTLLPNEIVCDTYRLDAGDPNPMNPTATRRRAALHTLGCRLNQSETQALAEQLTAQGYDLVPFGEDADLGIINTCTVTHEADAKSRQMIRGFIRRNPNAYTAVVGCYAQMGHAALRTIPGIDLIVGNQEKMNLLHYVAEGKNDAPIVVRDRIVRDDFTLDFPEEQAIRRRANLKVQDGCDFMCSFCIIPFARGRARSRALPNVLDEARSLVARGARELVLTGVNIGTYGWNDRDILAVVDALDGIEGLDRIRISSIEPTTIPEALFERMADPAHALVPYLHIPLQSGSDAVLSRMKRRYTRAEFEGFIAKAAAAVPDLGIGTDVLVGMPGETDADFEETCAVLTDGPIAYAHVFKYSEREGTPAVKYPDKVPADTMQRRSARVRAISERKRQVFARARVGQEVEVLFEHAEQGFWSGYTGNYIRVAARSNEDLTNRLATVRVAEVIGDIAYGELTDAC